MEYLHHLLGALPPWAYVVIIGGGIAGAYFLPKLIGGQNSNASPTSASGNVTDAIDPNTGLPYPLSGYPGGALAGNNGQTTGSTDDTAALLAVLQSIALRLNPSPASVGVGGGGSTAHGNGGGGSVLATNAPTTKLPTKQSVGAVPITLSGATENADTSAVFGAVPGAALVNGAFHVSAQPQAVSTAGGNAVVTSSGASLSAQQRAAAVTTRLNRAGV